MRRKTKTVPEPNFNVETITPELARRLLHKNTSNRRVRDATVEQYARDMRDGNWLLTGAPILLNGTGQIFDGQHRLMACVAAKRSFKTVVGRGIEQGVQKAVDTGLKRTMADLLKWRGEKNCAVLAALIYFSWRYDQDVISYGNIYPSHAEALDWLDEQKPLPQTSVKATYAIRSRVPLPSTTVAAGHFLTSRIDPKGAADFFEQLVSGAGLTEGSPVLVLNKWADAWATKRDRPATIVYNACLLKAMNAFRSGHDLKLIRWRRDEPFPRVWGEA